MEAMIISNSSFCYARLFLLMIKVYEYKYFLKICSKLFAKFEFDSVNISQIKPKYKQMKKLSVTNILMFVAVLGNSQILSHQAILSSGGEFANSSAQISWTLGDLQTATYIKDQLILTQGFLQSDIKVTAIIELDEKTNISVKIFPNPVKQNLYLKVLSRDEKKLSWQLIGQTGNIIKSGKINSQNTEINFSLYPDGIYFLKAFSGDGSYFKIFKIMKIE